MPGRRARRDGGSVVDRTSSAMVAALEQHRAVTASLLVRLDALAERGGSSVERVVGPFRSRLREEDRALEPLVDLLARR